jgi:hypothetical protein
MSHGKMICSDDAVGALLKEFDSVARGKGDVQAVFSCIVRLVTVCDGASDSVFDNVFARAVSYPECLADCNFLVPFTSPSHREILRRAAIANGNFSLASTVAKHSGITLRDVELVRLAEASCKLQVCSVEALVQYVKFGHDVCDFMQKRILRILRQHHTQRRCA